MLLSLGLYWTAWDRLYAGLKLGRAPRTKETLPDFLKWRRVTRPPLIFRGLTGSQRTPGFWGVTRRGARSAGGQAAAPEAGAGVGSRGAGREHAERAAWAHGARGLGVPVRAGWACWLVSWASFGA